MPSFPSWICSSCQLPYWMSLLWAASCMVALQASLLGLRCQVMIWCLVIKPPCLPSDLHLLLHLQWYLHHCPAIRLHQVMWSKSILTHQNFCLLKALGIQHEMQHESQITMILNYWNLTCSLTWNWSQRKMNCIWNFVNDVETETGSDYASRENRMHVNYLWDHHRHQLCMPLHQWWTHLRQPSTMLVQPPWSSLVHHTCWKSSCSTSSTFWLLCSGGTWEKSKASILNLCQAA